MLLALATRMQERQFDASVHVEHGVIHPVQIEVPFGRVLGYSPELH